MIKTEEISPCALKIVPSENLSEADFHGLAQQVNPMIAKCGQVGLLIDASGFNGWESFAAFEPHMSFIKNHQRNVERIAAVVGHDWIHPSTSCTGADFVGNQSWSDTLPSSGAC
jgi:hypothetical protein